MTFIPLSILLFILFVPSLILALFTSKKVLAICGYRRYIEGNQVYNTLIHTLSYILITMSVGNVLVCAFLLVNYCLAKDNVQTLVVKPINIAQGYSRTTRSYYSHFDITLDHVTKQINAGKNPVEEIAASDLQVEVSRGYFGYYIIRNRRFLRRDAF